MRSFADSEYLQEVYRIERIGNNYRITADQLASLEDYVDFCYNELRKFESERKSQGIGISTIETLQVVVGSVFKFSDMLKEKIDKEKSQVRQPSDNVRKQTF